jgi:hypothetical protein
MWIIQKPKKVALWNKRHFEKGGGNQRVCSMFKNSVRIFVEKKNKMGCLKGSGVPCDARFLKVNVQSSVSCISGLHRNSKYLLQGFYGGKISCYFLMYYLCLLITHFITLACQKKSLFFCGKNQNRWVLLISLCWIKNVLLYHAWLTDNNVKWYFVIT